MLLRVQRFLVLQKREMPKKRVHRLLQADKGLLLLHQAFRSFACENDGGKQTVPPRRCIHVSARIESARRLTLQQRHAKGGLRHAAYRRDCRARSRCSDWP